MKKSFATFLPCLALALGLSAQTATAAQPKPGAYFAIGDLCGRMISEAVIPLKNQFERNKPEFGFPIVNRLVERAYGTIGDILDEVKSEEDASVGGDRPFGYARLATVAIEQMEATASFVSETEQPSQDVITEMYFACRKTMKQRRLIYPAGYPYGEDD